MPCPSALFNNLQTSFVLIHEYKFLPPQAGSLPRFKNFLVPRQERISLLDQACCNSSGDFHPFTLLLPLWLLSQGLGQNLRDMPTGVPFPKVDPLVCPVRQSLPQAGMDSKLAALRPHYSLKLGKVSLASPSQYHHIISWTQNQN